MFSCGNILLLLSSLVLSIRSEEFAERYYNQVANQLMEKEEVKEVESKTNLNFNSSIVDAHEYIKKLYETFHRESDPRGMPEAKMPDVVHSYVANLTDKSNVFRFNLTGAHAEEFILKAEIRLKLPKNRVQWPRGSHSRVLTLYDVTTQKQPSPAVHLDANQQWVVFPVRSLVKRWLRFPQTNHGVRVVLKNRKTEQLESPNLAIINEMGADARQPLLQLLIFADRKTHHLSTAAFKRPRRNSETEPETKAVNSSSALRNTTAGCFRRKWYLSTEGLFGLNVIAPQGYSAYTCQGTCAERPIRNRADFKNHQGALEPTQNPVGPGVNVQCVPSRYKSLTILYATAEDHVLLENIPNMVVSECKCSYSDNYREAARDQ